jgi:hypothetical protein
MASPTFQVEDTRNDPEKKKRGPWFGCLIGCLVVLGFLVLLTILGVVFGLRNWKGLAVGGVAMGLKAEIDQSELPAEEKAQIKVEIDRMTDSVSGDQSTAEDVAQFMQVYAQEFVNSPLMGTVMLSAAEQEQIETSGLSDEEKADAKLALHRLLRGMIDRKIPESDGDAAADHIAMRQQPNNRWRLKPTVSDEELRSFTTDAKKAADDAGVAEQPGPFDPSEEVKKVVNAALSWNKPQVPDAGEPGDMPAEEVPQSDEADQ